MIRWTEIGQECGHLIERSSTNGFVISTTGKVISDLLLMIPEETMQGEDVGIADVGHRIGRAENTRIRRTSFNGLLFVEWHDGSEIHRFTDRSDEIRHRLERRTKIIVEAAHVKFFGEHHVIGDVLQDLRDQRQSSFDARQGFSVDNAEFVWKNERRIEKTKEDHCRHSLGERHRDVSLFDKA